MRRGVPCAVVLLLATGLALAQDPNACDEPGEAPDVIVGDLFEVQRYGTVGDITSYSVGTISCNIGTCWLNWMASTPEHPVIAQNMFRLKDGRFEQIGQSWLKHGFFALSEQLCTGGCVSTDGTHLGVNCSDPYTAGLNGSQSGLGPRSEVNPSTGEFPYPFGHQGETGDSIYKRLQVHNDDLDPTLNAGALYFVEGQYVTHDDATAGNNNNNASYRQVAVNDAGGGIYNLSFVGSTQRQFAGIQAWARNQSQVKQATIDVAGDGRFILAAHVTSLGGGSWRYEYALQNLNSYRAAGAVRVPLPVGANLSNVGFHDVDSHSGEPYDGTDWNPVHDTDGAQIVWSTTDFAVDPEANALRWGTLYNFRFDADVAPAFGPVAVDLFRPGSPAGASASTFVPDPCNNDGICDPHETCLNCAADCVNAQSECCGDGTCDPGEDRCACAADCGAPPPVESLCGDAIDEDCDGATDCADLDCCTDGLCADGIDADGDGVAECDCDDANPAVWETPGEVVGLMLDEAGGTTTLTWAAPWVPGATTWRYEVLRSVGSGFGLSATCGVAADPTAEVFEETELPAPGVAFRYLVRAVNDCPQGDGPLGVDSAGATRAGRTCP